MDRLRTLLCLCLLAGPSWVQADCECLWQGSFADVQGRADLVVAGQVVASKGNSVDLDIERTLRGKAPLPEIRVWMAARDYCRPDVAGFPVGSGWVMALTRVDADVPGGFDPDTPNISYGRVGDYSLSNCGGYWLQLEGDRVSGPLVDAPRWERTPMMTPVLLDLVAAFTAGEIDAAALREASRPDPELRRLMLDTRAFLREGGSE